MLIAVSIFKIFFFLQLHNAEFKSLSSQFLIVDSASKFSSPFALPPSVALLAALLTSSANLSSLGRACRKAIATQWYSMTLFRAILCFLFRVMYAFTWGFASIVNVTQSVLLFVQLHRGDCDGNLNFFLRQQNSRTRWESSSFREILAVNRQIKILHHQAH